MKDRQEQAQKGNWTTQPWILRWMSTHVATDGGANMLARHTQVIRHSEAKQRGTERVWQWDGQLWQGLAEVST